VTTPPSTTAESTIQIKNAFEKSVLDPDDDLFLMEREKSIVIEK
jgi:hypothetical protein